MSSASIQAKILSIVAVFVIGFTIHSGVVHRTTPETLEQSDYRDVMNIKDLIADSLPPPVYVVEPFMVALEAARESDKQELGQLRDRWRKLEQEHTTRMSYWSEHLPAGALRTAVVETSRRSSERLLNLGNSQFWPAMDAGDKARADSAINEMKAAFRENRQAILEMSALAEKTVQDNAAAAASTIGSRKLMLLGLGLLITASGVIVAVAIARNIARRTRQMADTLDRVARGDLSQRAEVAANDELGQMARQLNGTLESIERVFAEVREISGALATTASGLAQSSDQISQGAQQQAASLEETAASLEEITATVKQSAGNAQQADQVAVGSRDVAERGGSVVAGAISAMDEITKASRRIGDIITTIDEIALQTNLLALNAAVEAARAGEQGRGFAVVASEVGNLAQRSAAAAKEVKSLIQDSLERIQAGHELVGESGRALNDIIISVKKVTDIVGEIASAAREQSIGVDQVNQAVSQMDQVTQSNAAQTDQLSHTAQGLAEHAENLKKLLMRFQLSASLDKNWGGGGMRQDSPAARKGKRSARRAAAPSAAATYDFDNLATPAANDNDADQAGEFEVLSSGNAKSA
jgi:methyl-accepting chemotaxis protein